MSSTQADATGNATFQLLLCLLKKPNTYIADTEDANYSIALQYLLGEI